MLAQPYVEGGNTRHRFAQLGLGLDVRHFSGFNTSIKPISNFTIQPHTETRLIIGGTHFWGHADFYIAFPIISIGQSHYGTLIETGARYFPFRIENNTWRPFIGISWQPDYFQKDEGPIDVRNTFPFSAGVVFNLKQHLLEFNIGYNFSDSRQYYMDRFTPSEVYTPSFWVGFGYKYLLETTLSAERAWLNGGTAQQTELLAALGRLDGFTVSVGPSSVIYLDNAKYNSDVAPYLGQHRFSKTFVEWGIGYYWHNVDLQVNVAYRGVSSELKAHGHFQEINRKALTLESYKFIADYHGFAPFIGLGLSSEWLSLRETFPGGRTANQKNHSFQPGLTFGWDIRPDRIQSWYLRTNLRWFPFLRMDMGNGNNFSMNQLEFNFIQLVILPERFF